MSWREAACNKHPLLPVMTGEKEEAVQWYKKGISVLERGIEVEITGQGKYANKHPDVHSVQR